MTEIIFLIFSSTTSSLCCAWSIFECVGGIFEKWREGEMEQYEKNDDFWIFIFREMTWKVNPNPWFLNSNNVGLKNTQSLSRLRQRSGMQTFLLMIVLLSRLETDCWFDQTLLILFWLYIFFIFFFIFFSVYSVFFLLSFSLDAPLSLSSLFSSLLSLSYLETCLMVPYPPQFPPPPLLVEISSLVSGWTRWMVEEESSVDNP